MSYRLVQSTFTLIESISFNIGPVILECLPNIAEVQYAGWNTGTEPVQDKPITLVFFFTSILWKFLCLGGMTPFPTTEFILILCYFCHQPSVESHKYPAQNQQSVFFLSLHCQPALSVWQIDLRGKKVNFLLFGMSITCSSSQVMNTQFLSNPRIPTFLIT